MRVPSFIHRPNWQRFLSGVVIGACISWVIFLFMFGVHQERQAKVIEKQTQSIKELEAEKQIWQDEYKKINRKNASLLIIQNVNLHILNEDKYDIDDSQSIYEAEEEIKKDINSLLAKDVNTVYQNKDLIIKAIENKTVLINKRRYHLDIKDIFFYSTITINVNLKLAT